MDKVVKMKKKNKIKIIILGLLAFLFLAIIGFIISLVVSLLNMIFFHSTITELVITVIGVLIFCGYIVYDMKNVQSLLLEIGEEKAAVYGAFQLYLDFINLFIRLIELFGKRKD